MPEIITTIESSPDTVKAVRAETPVGVGGEAVQRIPYSSSLEKLLEQGITSRVIASTTRCIRTVDVPVKGGTVKFHCSRACVGVNGQQLCPEHDRAGFLPSQTPSGPKPPVTNSASIKLTSAELAEMGITSDPATEGGNVSPAVVQKSPAVTKAPPAPTPKPKPSPKPRKVSIDPANQEGIKLYLTLQDLESKDLLPTLVGVINAALDNLPSGTIARMKKIMALQERVARLAE